MWAGAIAALMVLMASLPLIGSLRAILTSSLAGDSGGSLHGADLAADQSIAELSGLLGGIIVRFSVSLALLLFVVIPFSYGAALAGLRAMRAEQPRRGDFFAPYFHAREFALFSVALLLVTIAPLAIWLVVAVVLSVIATIVLSSSGADPLSQVPMITMLVMVVGFPFVFLSVYLQFRFVYGGVAIIDPRMGRVGALGALAKSWRMTRNQNWPLSIVALYAMWAPIREAVRGCGIGLFTRGLPEFLALFSGSYEVLVERTQSQETP